MAEAKHSFVDDNDYYTSDKTAQEIYNAFNSGLNCIAVDPDFGIVFYLSCVMLREEYYLAVFTSVQAHKNPTSISVVSTEISLSGDVEQYNTVEYTASSE